MRIFRKKQQFVAIPYGYTSSSINWVIKTDIERSIYNTHICILSKNSTYEMLIRIYPISEKKKNVLLFMLDIPHPAYAFFQKPIFIDSTPRNYVLFDI